jgi:hypothetical protein
VACPHLWQLSRDLDLLAHRADSLDVTKGQSSPKVKWT